MQEYEVVAVAPDGSWWILTKGEYEDEEQARQHGEDNLTAVFRIEARPVE